MLDIVDYMLSFRWLDNVELHSRHACLLADGLTESVLWRFLVAYMLGNCRLHALLLIPSVSCRSQGDAIPVELTVKLAADDLEPFQRTANNLLQQYILLLIEPENKVDLVELLKASPVATTTLKHGEGDGSMLIFADTNGYGEAAHCPQVRKVPLSFTHFAKLLDAVKQARTPTDADPRFLTPGDIYCLIDAGNKKRKQTFARILKPSVAQPKKKCEGKTISTETMLFKTEESVLVRQRKSRGQLKLTEMIVLMHNGTTIIEPRNRLHFPGSTRCDTLGPVAMPPWESGSKVDAHFKKQFWGNRLRRVGGRVPGAEDADDAESSSGAEDDDAADVADVAKIVGDGLVPMSYHMLPRTVFAELLHWTWAAAVIDIMPHCGIMAECALSAQIGYVGICHNEVQRDFIMQRLRRHMLKEMGTQETRNYNVAYGKLLSDTAEQAKREKCERTDGKSAKGGDPAPPGKGQGEGGGTSAKNKTAVTPKGAQPSGSPSASSGTGSAPTSSPATGAPGSDGLPHSLAAMLAAAKAEFV